MNSLGQIGPHEDREIEIMLAGTKPAALITYPAPVVYFIPHVKSGKFLWAMIRNASPNPRIVSNVFTQANEGWRINAIATVYEKVRETNHMNSGHYFMIGYLLGYSVDDITAFITRQIV